MKSKILPFFKNEDAFLKVSEQTDGCVGILGFAGFILFTVDRKDIEDISEPYFMISDGKYSLIISSEKDKLYLIQTHYPDSLYEVPIKNYHHYWFEHKDRSYGSIGEFEYGKMQVTLIEERIIGSGVFPRVYISEISSNEPSIIENYRINPNIVLTEPVSTSDEELDDSEDIPKG